MLGHTQEVYALEWGVDGKSTVFDFFGRKNYKSTNDKN